MRSGAVAVAVPALRQRASSTFDSAAIFVATSGAVLAVAASNGGYFASTWSWAALFFAWAATTAAVVGTALPRSRLALTSIGAFIGLSAWMLLSLVWSHSGAPVFEAERTLLYLTAAAAAVVALRRHTVAAAAGGVLAGLTGIAAYALATRLLPDRIATQNAAAVNRLATPIGYWNGLGITVVLGIVLAVGLAARARTTAARALAAATLPILLPTLYFTFSRGSWLALGVALVVLLALDARRLQLVTFAAPALAPGIIALVLAWRADALGQQGASVAAAAHAGHPLARSITLLALAAVCVSVFTSIAANFVHPGRAVRRGYGAVLLVVAVLAVVVGLAKVGGPAHATRRAWHSFTSSPISVQQGGQERKRLFSLSSNGRIDLWRAAWHEGKAHPLVGGGAGSYESWWLQHRPNAQKVRDAHSLYLQTFGELGIVGLALLLVALLTPLAAAVRARREPLVAAAAAAYVAYLAHAAGDWDWQLAGVTVPAILLGALLVAASRDDHAPARRLARPAAIAAGCAAGVLSVLMLLGNVPLTRAGFAADAGNWSKSAQEARQAIRWLPWSSEPWRLLGEAQLAQRHRAAAAVDLRRALAKDSRNWQLWFDLAAAERGRAAARALARAAQLNPLSPEIATVRKFGF